MSQSLVQNLIHLTFSTKDRRPLIKEEIQGGLNGYVVGILRNWDSPSVITNCVEDHIHILFSLSKNDALKTIVEEVKKSSSKWMKTNGPQYRSFYWQGGYGAFSVSQSNVERVKRYIENQQEHHRRVTFQDEFRALLNRHGIEWDERYVWD